MWTHRRTLHLPSGAGEALPSNLRHAFEPTMASQNLGLGSSPRFFQRRNQSGRLSRPRDAESRKLSDDGQVRKILIRAFAICRVSFPRRWSCPANSGRCVLVVPASRCLLADRRAGRADRPMVAGQMNRPRSSRLAYRPIPWPGRAAGAGGAVSITGTNTARWATDPRPQRSSFCSPRGRLRYNNRLCRPRWRPSQSCTNIQP